MLPTSEDALLERIGRFFPLAEPPLLLGRGDDCAVLPDCGPLCVSTDWFMEDVHFRRRTHTPEDIGHKALAVNLSDLAAAGAMPVAFTCGLALPPDADSTLVDGLCEGMAQLARAHDLPLAGGDLSRAEKLHLCLTVFGRSEAPGGSLKRTQAREGDIVFLIGPVGLSAAGFARLEALGRAALTDWPRLTRAHLRPEPLLHEGRKLAALAARGMRLGVMDVSDGLARDLPRLVGPTLGVALSLPAPPEELARHARQCGKDPRTIMVTGGEDYALIGTCSPKDAAHLVAALGDVSLLGRVITTPGVWLDGTAVAAGFDHFQQGI